MPFVNVKLTEGVFSPEQKQRIAPDLTDVMVAIEGEPDADGSPTKRGRGCPHTRPRISL
jgi:hypothetical protein